jgi:hypothetical protein
MKKGLGRGNQNFLKNAHSTHRNFEKQQGPINRYGLYSVIYLHLDVVA